MNNLPVPKAKISFLFYFFFHFLLKAIAISNESIYTPTDEIFLSCGSSGGTDSTGRQWTGDIRPSGTFLLSPNRSTAASATYQGSADTIPYRSARLSTSSFTYSLSVSPGKKFLRLHFYPDTYGGFSNGKRDYFNIEAGQHVLLRNFSASIFAADWGVPYFNKEFCVSVARDEQLNVSFNPFTDDFQDSYAFINGIEIISMPDSLYYSSNDSTGPPYIGQNKEVSIGNDTVMENMCRFNVGGFPISETKDTGMDRTWDPDGDNMYPLYGVIPREPNVTLNYSRIPRYIAPEDLYKSGRSMGRDRVMNLVTNMTWVVLVDSGFDHLVRLHFCEFSEQVTSINDRRFVIYIDNQTAEAGFDVFEASGGKNIPIYKDYIVRTGRRGVASDYWLFIKLHPHPSSVFADVLLNGLEVFKLSDSDGNLAVTTNPNPPTSQAPEPAPEPAPLLSLPPCNKSKKVTLYGIIGEGSLFCLLMIFLLCLLLVSRLKKRKKNYDHDAESSTCCWFLIPDHLKSSRKGYSTSLPTDLCRKFSLSDIKSITNNFHRDMIIGRGGFGYVYRGEIEMDKKSKTEVAIKRSDPELRSRSNQGAKEFKAEVEMLSHLRHANIVSLIGYCDEEGEMILVYEYIGNGTLDSHLYGTDHDPIPWRQRVEICIGAARGLQYLHEGAVNKVVHRDVKTTNILLDENWVAKVSDFGLSKMFLEDKAVTTVAKGTWGYMDPEYFRGHTLTEKSDVYSFGVVLLEVLCARKAVDMTLEEDQRSLANWAQKCIKQGTIHEAIDPYLMGRIAPECFNIFVDILERCIRNHGVKRPSMRDVMNTLEFALKIQEAADSEQKKGKDCDGVVGGFVYPFVPFRARPLHKLEEIDNEDDGFGLYSDDTFTGPMDPQGTHHSTSTSGSLFSGTTSYSTRS